jgi:hypothetical protein
MLSMFRKGDCSARNWLLELGPDRRYHWGRHGCAFWRVPGLPSMAFGMADLPPSTPHAHSTWWPRAGQSIDAGRCLVSWSEKNEEVAHRRRRAGAQRLRTYLQHMDCQRPAGSPQARRIYDPASRSSARPHDGHISRRWRGPGRANAPDLGQP